MIHSINFLSFFESSKRTVELTRNFRGPELDCPSPAVMLRKLCDRFPLYIDFEWWPQRVREEPWHELWSKEGPEFPFKTLRTRYGRVTSGCVSSPVCVNTPWSVYGFVIVGWWRIFINFWENLSSFPWILSFSM